mmetsp:Transcript_88401/g.202180  ORF Transcript_88401/g.202180 Transcript_88401/m.202180 type:complete len:168 (+) Transcript_88401:6790-7293(+)
MALLTPVSGLSQWCRWSPAEYLIPRQHRRRGWSTLAGSSAISTTKRVVLVWLVLLGCMLVFRAWRCCLVSSVSVVFCCLSAPVLQEAILPVPWCGRLGELSRRLTNETQQQKLIGRAMTGKVFIRLTCAGRLCAHSGGNARLLSRPRMRVSLQGVRFASAPQCVLVF